MGRYKKPIEQLQREGTFRSDRHAGPRPAVVKPTAPEGLNEKALAMWKKLSPIICEMGIYTAADELALRMLCESYALYVEACDDIDAKGTYITQVNRTGNEYYTDNPSVKARGKYWREVVEVCRQFGMTPVSRTGLHVGKPEEGGMSALDRILAGARN